MKISLEDGMVAGCHPRCALCRRQKKNYLNLGDRMAVFRCCWNRSYYLRTCILKHGGVVINIEDVHSDYGLPFPSCSVSLALNVECVEEKWDFL